jgi:Domain of unknown function (DUF4129)
MRKSGLPLLRRAPFLALAWAMAGFSSYAQGAPKSSQGDLEIDLGAYKAELDRCAESIRQGESPAQLRESLPRNWVIQTEQSRIVVSTDWLTAELRQAELDPGKSKAALRTVQGRLAAMHKAATDLEGGSNGADAQSARAHLDKVLQRREFAGANGPSEMELLQARIARWIEQRLLRLLSLLHVGRMTGNVITWGIVALAFAMLCYWAWRNISRALRNATPAPQLAPAADDSRHWAKEAFAAAERGDYREAVHCAYWATIVHLEGLGLLKRDAARTPRECLRLLEPHPKQRQLLGEFTPHFELIWYGYRPASPEDWTNARVHLEKLGCLTASTPATVNS